MALFTQEEQKRQLHFQLDLIPRILLASPFALRAEKDLVIRRNFDFEGRITTKMSVEKEKIPVEEVKFLPNGAEEALSKGDVEKGKAVADDGAFVGLTKEELQQYADDPYWVS